MSPEQTNEQALFAAYHETWRYLDRVTWQLPILLLVIVLVAGLALPFSGYSGVAFGLALRWGLLGLVVLAGAWQQFRYLQDRERLEQKLRELEEQLVPMLLAPGHFASSPVHDEPGFVARLRQPKWLWGYLLVAASAVYLLAALAMLLRWLAWAL